MSRTNMIVAYIVMVAFAVGLYFGGVYINFPYLKMFFPSNSSMFESLKYIVYPCFFYLLIDLLFIRRNINGAFSSYITGMVLALIFKICVYYTIEGIVGYVVDYIEYIIYAISLGIIIYYRNKKITLLSNVSSVIVVIIIMIIIAIFSYFPSDLNIFI